MEARQLTWRWRDRSIKLGFEVSGRGPTVLLLPALSSISTRSEMHGLQSRLGGAYRTVAIDWPGFGDLDRPTVGWTPDAYAAFLDFVIERVTSWPHAVIAAGHAATYALAHACNHPDSMGRLVLVAPTWRGPLPTMTNGRWLSALLGRTTDIPLVGPLLYRLNVNRVVIRLMARGHVYADPGWLNAARMSEKLAVVRAAGARFASIRFVTGMLDPLTTRDAFLDLARRTRVPILTIHGAQTPRRSLSEMEALAAIPGVRCARLPMGKLGVHEEFPDDTADIIAPFLAGNDSVAGSMPR